MNWKPGRLPAVVDRILIVGGVGVGKTTLANQERERLGLQLFRCTDTLPQASKTGRTHPSAVYAPDNLEWSDLSQWVSEFWLPIHGPWVIEGIAVCRALRKWRQANPDAMPPCTKVIWLTEPQMRLSDRQVTMSDTHDDHLTELLEEWPELAAVLEQR